MEMMAKVGEETGMKPNCCGSITLSKVGFTSCSIMNASAIFDNVDVKEIGLRYLLKSAIVCLRQGGNICQFPCARHFRFTEVCI